MIWKTQLPPQDTPDSADIDLLLGQAVRDLCDRQPRRGMWERLRAQLSEPLQQESWWQRLVVGDEHWRVRTSALSVWEASFRPLSWNRITF